MFSRSTCHSGRFLSLRCCRSLFVRRVYFFFQRSKLRTGSMAVPGRAMLPRSPAWVALGRAGPGRERAQPERVTGTAPPGGTAPAGTALRGWGECWRKGAVRVVEPKTKELVPQRGKYSVIEIIKRKGNK